MGGLSGSTPPSRTAAALRDAAQSTQSLAAWRPLPPARCDGSPPAKSAPVGCRAKQHREQRRGDSVTPLTLQVSLHPHAATYVRTYVVRLPPPATDILHPRSECNLEHLQMYCTHPLYSRCQYKKHSLDPFMIPKHCIMYQGGSSRLFKTGICTSMQLRDMTSESHAVEAHAKVLN